MCWNFHQRIKVRNKTAIDTGTSSITTEHYTSTKTYTHYAFRTRRKKVPELRSYIVRLWVKLRPSLSMADQYKGGWVVFNVAF
ncbi:hypothetical protein VTL71DRAFT_4984, partial [Oculimacula yallundae]